jgi:hypothetical protein
MLLSYVVIIILVLSGIKLSLHEEEERWKGEEVGEGRDKPSWWQLR